MTCFHSKMILKTILCFTILSMIYEFKIGVQSAENEEASSSTYEYIEDQSEKNILTPPPTTEDNKLKLMCDFCDSTDHIINNCLVKNQHCFICFKIGHLYTNCSNRHRINPEELEKKKVKILNTFNRTQEEIRDLEMRTRIQEQSEEWHQERKYRLTASTYGRVCLYLNNSNSQAELNEIGISNIIFSKILQKRKGKVIMNKDAIIKSMEFDEDVQPTGLFIDKKFQFLGGSPDGIINDMDAIVKIIFSSTWEKKKINEKEKNGKIVLKDTDQYYFQVQGLLHLTKKRLCYFVVWTGKVIRTAEILRDDVLWTKMEKLLVKFYQNHFLTAIVSQREISQLELDEEKKKILDKLAVTPQKILDLQEATKDQDNNWHLERKNRLAAPEFGTLCRLKENTNWTKTMYDIITNRIQMQTENNSYGHILKTIAIKKFVSKGYGPVISAGLFVDKNFQYLCGAPDGLIGTDAIVKVLSPVKWKDMEIAKVAQEKSYILTQKNDENNEIYLSLNTKDDYYYQIQGLLYITKRTLCYFVVGTEKGITVEKIKRDVEFWEVKMRDQLKTFYDRYLVKLAEHNLNMAYVKIPANPQVSP